MTEKLQTAIKLFRNFKLNEAEKLLKHILKTDTENIEALVFMGKVYSRKQQYGEATNYFKKALNLDKNNLDAKVGIDLINSILKLSNNYYYENPYTDDDLYDF
jgi:Tfp pilus assembly protein PilF